MTHEASTDHRRSTGGLAGLARAGGVFAMLAIDQRESLRTLLVGAGHGGTDADLSAFKVDVARTLSPSASGMLVDRDYGLGAIVAADALAATCGLIVAVDRFTQEPGGPLEWSELDRPALTDALVTDGATALKFLVIWRPDDPVEPRRILVRDFIDGCRRLGLVSVLEGLVQVPGLTAGPAVDRAILAAAQEFAPFAPDLYKTHVPTLGIGSPDEITEQSAAISAAIGRPWVVLSAGVPVERFPAAVAAAGRGGASGFLAGRGVWGPAIRTPDPAVALAEDSRPRMDALVAIADETARPWWDAAAPVG
jgi:sulfofructosephosphate aldolase